MPQDSPNDDEPTPNDDRAEDANDDPTDQADDGPTDQTDDGPTDDRADEVNDHPTDGPNDGTGGTDRRESDAEDGSTVPEDARQRDRASDDRRQSASPFDLHSGLEAFAELLRTLDDERRTGSDDSGRAVVDYDVSVGLGPGPGDRRSDRGSAPDRSSGRQTGRERRPRVRRSRGSPTDYLVTTREVGGDGSESADAFVVTADLPGVDAEDLTVGFGAADETLVIAVDGSVIERVSLPWPARTAESTIRNGVLEVRLREDT